MKEMILYGASGHAKVILEILEACGHTAFCFWDDAVKPDIRNHPVGQPAATLPEGASLVLSIGSNRVRKLIASRYGEGTCFATAVHPRSNLSGSAHLDAGTVCMAGVSINADVTIGRHCIINTNASVDHDCVLGDYVHISPNAALCGDVRVDEGSHIGAGAVVLPGIRIGRWCTIGAGAVVTRDVPDYATAYGNPARVMNITRPDSQPAPASIS